MLKRNTGIRLYNSLLFDDEAVSPQELPSLLKHGRDPKLVTERDTFLLYRFFFKSRIQRKIFDDALGELKAEVFLSKTMIQKILLSKSDEILLIKKAAPTPKELRDKYPHIVWN